MKTTISKSLTTITAKVCAFGLIHMLTFGTNVGILSSPEAIVDAMQMKEEETVDVDQEMLWFARAIYSESKKPEEQALVAWVIRNRVESTKYPGAYEDVVLQPGQFSGLSVRDAQYWTNSTLTFDDHSPSWDSAVEIAEAVYRAPGAMRPFSKNVMHFYSPISVVRTPSWAEGRDADHIVHDDKGNARFAFYSDII